MGIAHTHTGNSTYPYRPRCICESLSKEISSTPQDRGIVLHTHFVSQGSSYHPPSCKKKKVKNKMLEKKKEKKITSAKREICCSAKLLNFKTAHFEIQICNMCAAFYPRESDESSFVYIYSRWGI